VVPVEGESAKLSGGWWWCARLRGVHWGPSPFLGRASGWSYTAGAVYLSRSIVPLLGVRVNPFAGYFINTLSHFVVSWTYAKAAYKPTGGT
jgi:hypothetical protein